MLFVPSCGYDHTHELAKLHGIKKVEPLQGQKEDGLASVDQGLL